MMPLKPVLTAFILSTVCTANGIYRTPSLRGVEEESSKSYSDPKTIDHKLQPSVNGPVATADRQPKSRRKFVSYTSSYFEKLWLENVDTWANEQKICDILMDQQASLLHDWLNVACTRWYQNPHQWCIIDDAHHPLWYNTANRDEFEFSWTEPKNLRDAVLGEPKPTSPTKENDHVLSKYVFLDEITGEEYYEYIEPLVSHLRFPLAKCLSTASEDDADEHKHLPTTFRGWIIPPPPDIRRKRTLFFDIGSSSWNSVAAGGAALKYFSKVWQRQSIDFDEIYAFDLETSVGRFFQDFPANSIHATLHFQQCAVSGKEQDGSDQHPFVPNLVHRVAEPDDYVLFKLDIDSPDVERDMIESILQDPEPRITELVWEHHISGNYLMTEHWGPPETLDQASLRDSYDCFLRLRQKGIRAHSWV